MAGSRAPCPPSPQNRNHWWARRATLIINNKTRRAPLPTLRFYDSDEKREQTMKMTSALAALAAALLAGTSLAQAAEVTPQRLLNPEPQNWLMNHRTYDGQRYSPLARISKD